MKVVTIVGARPQFIKAAIVSHRIREYADFEEIMVHTGQHYDPNMSDIFFAELDIQRPEFNLDIRSGTHGVQTARMLESLEALFLKISPDWVLVYGDTNSTLASALAAAKLNIPVAHVEAGLRSFNREMPEEINRVLTDHISACLFAPTSTAVHNLSHEGIAADKVHQVGDVMYDAALFYGERALKHSTILEQHNLSQKNYILATVHRPSNTDQPEQLKTLFDGLAQVAQHMPVVVPLHPRTKEALKQANLFSHYAEKLTIIDPAGYLDMIQLEQAAKLIATDSGGVQKEAYFYSVPCVTLRKETEWVELVEVGANTLCPMENSGVVAACILNQAEKTLPANSSLYGDGDASSKIARILAGLQPA